MDKKIEQTKKQFPEGTRIELVKMEDEHAVPAGTKGTVESVDDMGTIHMKWDNGRTLGLVPGVDKFKEIQE